MNPIYLHLVLNHFPVIGVLLATILLAIGLWWKSHEIEAVAGLALLLLSGMTIPVYLSGDASEHAAERLAEVAGPLLHEHEEAAEIALIAACSTATLALVHLVLLRRRSAAARKMTVVLLLAGLFTTATLLRAAQLGGQARHPEIRGPNAAIQAIGEDEDAD